jgi:hypothetical protein
MAVNSLSQQPVGAYTSCISHQHVDVDRITQCIDRNSLRTLRFDR